MSQLTPIIDTLLSFGDLFDFDTQELAALRLSIDQTENPIKTPFPKARFFDFLSREMERLIDFKLDPFKEIMKKYNSIETTIDAILYKLKLNEQQQHNLQSQINDRPSRKDMFDLRESFRAQHSQFEAFLAEQAAKDQKLTLKLETRMANIVTREEHQESIANSQQEQIQYCQKMFAQKELSYNKLNNLECQFNFVNEQLLDLKKYSISNISGLIEKQNNILSDLTTTVKQHEFQAFLSESSNFVQKPELLGFRKYITAQVDELKDSSIAFSRSLQSFQKVLAKTDYDLLQKASKMDWELMKKSNEELRQAQEWTDERSNAVEKQVKEFQAVQEEQNRQAIELILETVNNSLLETINSIVTKIMKSYQLENVQEVVQHMQQSLRGKANKADVIEIFHLKCNKSDIQKLEQVISTATSNLKLFSQMFIDFLDIFNGVSDLESANYRKNQISKLSSEMLKLQSQFSKVTNNTQSHFRSESDDPCQASRRTQRTSPKNQNMKAFLRPLLSTTYQYGKKNKLNVSNI